MKYDFSKYKDVPGPYLSDPDGFMKPKKSWVEQRKWDIPDVFVVKVAPVGAFLTHEDNPHQKLTNAAIRDEVLECVAAGACAFHVHVRDEQGRHCLDVKYYHEVIDPIKQKYGKDVLVCGCPEGGKTVEESTYPLVEFKGVMETAPITVTTVNLTGETLACTNAEMVRAHVEIMQDVGCIPEIVLHNVGDISLARRWLIDTGVLKKPYSFRIAMGNPGWGYIEDQFSMAELLPFVFKELKKIDPDCAIMVDMAGRGSLFLVAQAIILGAYGARVGMEDALYMYPHKDEKISSNRSVVEKVIAVAEALGRKRGTADDYRRFIGLKQRC